MRVHDTYLRSQSSKVLVINVTDVNEPNKISAKFTTKTSKETKKRGIKFDFGLECSDEDFYDQQTLTIVSGTYKDYFRYCDCLLKRCHTSTAFFSVISRQLRNSCPNSIG
ncbi:hypothetical protein DPMN_051178 [Dreissena polymorpha]|uniref:Uncharacterized protein n=1 Tax=Dreissena polymorpha TaxID=45954 RepID=A0A9D4CHE8_DREPO|nr:hypothetical protein DPMN_051178 [Dreissena polymorpha]